MQHTHVPLKEWRWEPASSTPSLCPCLASQGLGRIGCREGLRASDKGQWTPHPRDQRHCPSVADSHFGPSESWAGTGEGKTWAPWASIPWATLLEIRCLT